MGSKEKFHSIISAAHGFDDIGFAQTAGTITSISRYGAPSKWSKYALVLANAAHNLTRGQAINITGTTDYDGPVRVVAVVSTTTFVINKPFTVTKSGAWDLKQAEGNWEAFMPLGADITAANVSFVYWQPEMQGGNEVASDFTKDKVYPIPGNIKKVIMATAGNMRLFRGASTRPADGRNTAAPVIVGYNPTGGTQGAVIDILGANFDRALSNNEVKFNGTVAYPTRVDDEGKIITVPIPAGATSGAVTVKVRGQNATGGTGMTIG